MTPTPENIDALLRRLPADSLSHALVTLLNGCPAVSAEIVDASATAQVDDATYLAKEPFSFFEGQGLTRDWQATRDSNYITLANFSHFTLSSFPQI